MDVVSGSLRACAMQALRLRPMTPDEVASHLGASILAIRPRMTELARLGLIVKTGATRENASGRLAHVYRALEPATKS